jgi:hypothetical protein
MKIHRNFALVVATLALTGLFAGTAHAREVVAKDAPFTLPWATIWGDTVLPGGNYTLSVVKLSAGRGEDYTVTIAGAGIKKTIVVMKRQGPDVGTSSMLVTEGRGDAHFIRELHLPFANLVLTFAEPKTYRTLVAQSPETKSPEIRQSVPIQVATK